MAGPEFTPLMICLRRSVVEGLSREVESAFESIPSRNMEIGGLLLGTTVRQTGVIQIEDFEPLEWEGRSDRFIPSESECRALDRTLAAYGSLRCGEPNVVGCYRSQIGKDFRLSAKDLAFARGCCGGPPGVFLLISRCSDGALTAAFCAWEHGPIDSEYTLQEFPFDVRQLAATLAETCESRVLDAAETAQPIAEPPQIDRSLPVAFWEPRAKPTEKVGVRVSAWRHRRQVWRAATLLARTRARRSVRTFLRRKCALPWRALTLQVLGYPFAVARAASQRVRTRVGQAGALVRRAFLAPVRTFLRQIRAFPWQAHSLRALAYLIAVWCAVSRAVLTRAGAFINQSPLAPARTSLSRTRTFPWWVRTLRVHWYSFAVLIIVMEVLGYRAYLSQRGSRASAKHQMISGHPLNLSRSQSEVLAMSVVRSAQTSAAQSLATNGQIAAPLKRMAGTGHRARRKPRVSSGKELPFTCSAGDVFHKTDAAPGWNTFTCRGKNVWSITRNRTSSG